MSLRDPRHIRPSRARSPFSRLAVVALVCLGLAGCFRPLYGPTASGGTVKDVLATVDVVIRDKPGEERISHYLRNELAYDLDGSGHPRPKQYKLEISVDQTLATALVNSTTGQANAATLFARAEYKLFRIGEDKPILAGASTGSASYDRTPQRYAAVRAARDAQIRVAKLIAEQLQTRLAAVLSAQS